mgnify:CR=1 FL=1
MIARPLPPLPPQPAGVPWPTRSWPTADPGEVGADTDRLTHLLDVRPVPWEWLRFESALAAYSVLQARALGGEGNVWSLQNFNELDHLRAAGLLAAGS